jgi:hypothetical protein
MYALQVTTCWPQVTEPNGALQVTTCGSQVTEPKDVTYVGATVAQLPHGRSPRLDRVGCVSSSPNNLGDDAGLLCGTRRPRQWYWRGSRVFLTLKWLRASRRLGRGSGRQARARYY